MMKYKRILVGVSRQRGFSLVTAIFLLVVIGALGMFAVTLSTTQHQSDAMDIMGKRAYQAARAGIEWGAYQIIQSSTVGFAPACLAGASNVSLTLPAPSLSQFTVNVACNSGGNFTDGVPISVYLLSASAVVTGSTAGTPDYVERKLSVTIAQ